MFFYISKLIWLLIEPVNFIFLFMLIGIGLLWTRWMKWGRRICMFALLLIVVLGLLPTGKYALQTLENRFPAVTEYPEKVDGVIVLGGVVNLVNTMERGQYAFGSNLERVLVLQDLTKRYPDAKVVFTSGAGLLGRPELKEAAMLKTFVADQMLHPERLIIETESRNTYENVKFSQALVKPQKNETWLLVTSASHMPRSMGIFRQFDWSVIPHPVDYQTGTKVGFKLMSNIRGGLNSFGSALHEWLGLLAYYLTGKSSELFPAPDS